MSAMTKSECLFEEILREKKMSFRRIPESVIQTPDYEVEVCGGKSYWEVKELEENDDEKSILSDIKNDKNEIYKVNSRRVENSIKSAAKQFKSFEVTNFPCIVVLFDSRNFAVADFLLDGYVKNVMLGNGEYMEQADGSFKEVNRHPGLLTNRRQYISAIGIMFEATKEIVLFHNPNASLPVSSTSFSIKFDHNYYAKQSISGLVWEKA